MAIYSTPADQGRRVVRNAPASRSFHRCSPVTGLWMRLGRRGASSNVSAAYRPRRLATPLYPPGYYPSYLPLHLLSALAVLATLTPLARRLLSVAFATVLAASLDPHGCCTNAAACRCTPATTTVGTRDKDDSCRKSSRAAEMSAAGMGWKGTRVAVPRCTSSSYCRRGASLWLVGSPCSRGAFGLLWQAAAPSS